MRTSSPRSGMLLTSLAAALMAVSLSGCLSSGSSSSNRAEAPAPADPLRVSTSEGDVRGINLNEIRVFRGIPYAAAPVGELRFAATEPAPQRDSLLELSESFGNDCPQTGTTGVASGEEDCLYLNVYAPENAENLPVMVWVHGGAFVLGSGGGEYDPTRLVQKDVVVVTLNYRLGLLGFMAHPDLEEDGGNFGLMDQQQALRWVKDNIAAFGGNPEQVTLFGESAGGHSVVSHIVSPRAKEENLFQRAIIQSGSYAPGQLPKAFAHFAGQAAASAAGCADSATLTECLRGLSVAEILAQQTSQSIPVVDPDSDLLPRSIADALGQGNFNTDLDIMIGSNQDEGTLFVALDELSMGPLENLGEATYRQRVDDLLGTYMIYDTNQIASDYLGFFADADQPLSLALSAIWTDFMFACTSRNQASQFASQDMNTYQYWFTDEDAPWTLVPGFIPLSFPQGATHAGEIPYVLYPEEVMRDRYTGSTEDVDTLASYMVDYWAHFARNGDPNTSDGVAPAWPEFSVDQQLQRLDLPQPQSLNGSVFSDYHRCGYWANPPLRPIGG